MRAEGGEALAIINKRNTRRYRKILPGVIDSLNRGTFEEKYINAFSNNDYGLQTYNSIDLSGVESRLDDIKKQGNTRYVFGMNGEVIEIKGNVKRIIRN